MMTSLLGSDREKGSFKSPLFYTYKLFSNNCRGNSIDTYVECDTFNTDKYRGIPFLDVTSVYSKETNTVHINVINRHKDKKISADIFSTSSEYTGKAVVSEVNRKDLNEAFVFDKKDKYIPEINEFSVKGNKLSYSFPAHSFVQIKVQVKK
jgi:alpha-N-arabinofuranosidase